MMSRAMYNLALLAVPAVLFLPVVSGPVWREPRDEANTPERHGDGYTNVEECLNGTDPTRSVDI